MKEIFQPEKILCVGNFDSGTGYAWRLIESLWVNISQNFSTQNYITLACYPTISDLNPALVDNGIIVYEHDFSTKLSLSTFETAKFISTNKIRVLYLTDRPFFCISYIFYRLIGIKKIIVHDHTPGYRKPINKAKLSIKKSLGLLKWFSADVIIGVSPYVCQRLSEVNGVPKSKIFLVTNGIADTNHIKTSYTSEVLKIITVARANYYKGIDFALKTIAKLKRANQSQIEYHLIGDGPDLTEFKNLAKSLNISDLVHFHGKRDDIEKILPTFDIAFHPSKGEAMCLAIVEYMRAGLPIVVSDNISVNSILERNYDAIFYNETDLKSSAEVLLQLINDKRKRKEIGQSARKSYLSKYKSELMLHSFNNTIGAQME